MKEVYVLKQSDRVYGFAYTVKDYVAQLDGKDRRMITSIFVDRKKRGRGYGRILLTRICEDADTEKVSLILGVSPEFDSPLQEQELTRFYARYGFKVTEGNIMIRMPIERNI